MNKVFGYALVSTVDQSTDTEIEALEKFGCDKIVQERSVAFPYKDLSLIRCFPYYEKGIPLLYPDFFGWVGVEIILLT